MTRAMAGEQGDTGRTQDVKDICQLGQTGVDVVQGGE